MIDSISKLKIYIIGRFIIQNELLAQHIQRSAGYPCVKCQNINQISTGEIKEHQILFLVDYRDDNWNTVFPVLKQIADMPDVECIIALFNVRMNDRFERDVPKYNILGIFYENDTLDFLIKWIRSIIKENLWSSKTLIRNFFLNNLNESYYRETIDLLSLREKQVLNLLIYGYSNAMISEELSISLYTVKNHVYRIYKKLNVKNRSQAVQYAINKLSAFG